MFICMEGILTIILYSCLNTLHADEHVYKHNYTNMHAKNVDQCHFYRRAKPKGSICLIFQVSWFCKTVEQHSQL